MTVAVALGVVTGVLGGIIRDVVCNEIPLVLRQDIYATASFVGALTFVLLSDAGLPLPWSGTLATAACFAVRGSAIVFCAIWSARGCYCILWMFCPWLAKAIPCPR